MGIGHSSVLARIIREGMDDYWRVVYSKTDEGLDARELQWKRAWEKDMERWEKMIPDGVFSNGR